ncbi:MAG: class I SAM-dependent methyltransferase [Verrucomicrobiota bacterium]
MLPKATDFVHELVAPRLHPGDSALDATAGNGHDTLFLARQVGPEGQVHAFDIQATAIESTRRRLQAHEASSQVHLHQSDHQHLARHLPPEARFQVILFNLGYLPGGPKTLTTRPSTPLRALEQAGERLEKKGLLLVTCYPGHPGGQEESQAVEAHLSEQPSLRVAKYSFLNLPNDPPFVLLAESR